MNNNNITPETNTLEKTWSIVSWDTAEKVENILFGEIKKVVENFFQSVQFVESDAMKSIRNQMETNPANFDALYEAYKNEESKQNQGMLSQVCTLLVAVTHYMNIGDYSKAKKEFDDADMYVSYIPNIGDEQYKYLDEIYAIIKKK